MIDIKGWRDSAEEDWPQRGWVNIGLTSNHDFAYSGAGVASCSGSPRLSTGGTYPFLEFYCREDVEAFTGALRDATDMVLDAPKRRA